MARTVEELLVYQKAVAAGRRINALLTRAGLVGDLELKSQISRCAIRVPSDVAEGFEQKTDRSFAKYLYDARGSAQELRTQLQIAADRNHIGEDECLECRELYAEVARMLSGLIRHLEKEDRRTRIR